MADMGPLYKEERRKQILECVETNSRVFVDELAEIFQVSRMTIRRDLQVLSEEGRIIRTHGGAVSLDRSAPRDLPAFTLAAKKYPDEKEIIGQFIAERIKAGETIYIGAGTTTFQVARALAGRTDITVVTNSLPAAEYFAQFEDLELIVTGGFLRRRDLSIVGRFAEAVVRELNLDKAIMGIHGIHPENGLTSEYPRQLMTDRSFMKTSENIIIAADHSKIGHISISRTADVTVARTIVTTSAAPLDIVESIRAKGVSVIFADKPEEDSVL